MQWYVGTGYMQMPRKAFNWTVEQRIVIVL